MKINTYELGQLGTNCYLLYPDNTNLAIVVDAPLEAAEEIPARLKADGKKLAAILLTHGHWDHLWDAGELQKITGAKLYAGAKGRELVESPEFQRQNLYAESDFGATKIDVPVRDGDTLDMGTRIDYMGAAAHIDREDELRRRGKLSAQAVRNRQLLRRVMREAGFKPLRTEWWHFNFKSRAEAKARYKVIR